MFATLINPPRKERRLCNAEIIRNHFQQFLQLLFAAILPIILIGGMPSFNSQVAQAGTSMTLYTYGDRITAQKKVVPARKRFVDSIYLKWQYSSRRHIDLKA